MKNETTIAILFVCVFDQQGAEHEPQSLRWDSGMEMAKAII